MFNSDGESEELWLDDFISYNERWGWGYNAGTGYKFPTTVEGYSVCESGITAESTSSEYSDCDLHTFFSISETDEFIVEMRLRTTDDNGITGVGQGSRGWGFWDGSMIGVNLAWFGSASPESDPYFAGFHAMVKRDNVFVLHEDISYIDIRQWHVYRIDLLESGTEFRVDGVLVASTSIRPRTLNQINLWIDNFVFQFVDGELQTGYLDVNQDQKMYIDWVRLSIPPTQDVTPPTTIHDYDGLWHNTDITITLTATDEMSGVAETYYEINDGATKTLSIEGQPIIITEGANNKLEYWSIDNAGNEESHLILTGIKLDKTAPTGSITINNDATYTTSTLATLTLTAVDANSGVYQVRFSNNGVWDTEPWETSSSTKAWTLPIGDGIKAVYYQIKDNAGLTSQTYSDTITLDTTAPVIEIPTRNPAGDLMKPDQSVRVSVNVTDVTSGVKNVTLYYTLDNGTTWEEPIHMNYNDSIDLYETTIPPQQAGTWVECKIVAYDNAKNPATKDVTESHCTYQVESARAPELLTLTSILLILVGLTVAVVIYKRKVSKTAHA
jgi:hypothetical protein